MSSWTRLDLTEYAGLPPETPEIAGLFYPGRRHLVSGPGESMKTWLCLVAAVAEVRAKRGVVWADLDGMGPREIAARLQALGLTEAELKWHVFFTNPEGALGEHEVRDLLDWAAACDCRLLVSDAFTGFLVQHGLDGNSGPDVETAWRLLDPFLAAGVAVVVIDHVVKNPDNQRGQAIGSERKGTAAHLHFDLKPGEKLARGGTGRSKVGVSRDRGAYFPRPVAGELVLHSNPDDGTITWALQPMAAVGDEFRPTGYMERVSRFIEDCEDVTKGAIEDGVGGKAKHVRDALEILVSEEYVARTLGAHGAQLHTSLKPFREADDVLVPSSSPEGTRTSQVAPNVLVPSSPPIGDEDEDEVRPRPHPRDEVGRGQADLPVQAGLGLPADAPDWEKAWHDRWRRFLDRNGAA